MNDAAEDFTVAEELSPRHKEAVSLAAVLARAGFSVSGPCREDNGRFHVIQFWREGPAVPVTGSVRVYSAEYFAVTYSCLPAPAGLPEVDYRLYGSVEETAAFLCLAFADGDGYGAAAVRLRRSKKHNRKP